jgi:hypothetical protein
VIAMGTEGYFLEYFEKLFDHVEGVKKDTDVVSGIT